MCMTSTSVLHELAQYIERYVQGVSLDYLDADTML